MITNLRFIYVIALFLLFLSCQKDNKTEIIPESEIDILTERFEDLNKSSITLFGSIKDINSLNQITEYGFIISYNNGASNQVTQDEIIVGTKPNNSVINYNYKPKNQFDETTTYNYTFFVKTKNKFIKGSTNSFQLEQISININQIISALPSELIEIDGNFKNLDQNYKLFAISEISKPVNYEINPEKNKLSFRIPADEDIFQGQTLKMELRKPTQIGIKYIPLTEIKILGKIYPPAQLTYYYDDVIKLFGTGISNFWDKEKSFQILIGDTAIPFSKEIEIKSLTKLIGNKFKLGYNNGRDSIFFTEEYKIITPPLDKLHFVSTKVHPGTNLILGKLPFNSYFNIQNTKYQLGNFPITEVRDSYAEQQLVFQTQDIPEGEYVFNISNNLFDINIPDRVEVKELKWTSISKPSAYPGEEVTIKGTFIQNIEYALISKNSVTPTKCTQDGFLTFKFPVELTHSESISIGYWKNNNPTPYKIEKPITFKALRMTFDDFYPKKGNIGSTVTLKGKGIGKAYEYMVGDIRVFPIVRNNDEVVFTIPFFVYKGNIRLSVIDGQKEGPILANDYFEIL